MMLAIYEDHPWANRDRADVRSGGREIADAGRYHCSARSGDGGSVLEAGAMNIPISGDQSANAAQHGGGTVVLHYPRAGRTAERKRDLAWFICHALSRSRVVPWGWFIARDRRCSRYEQLAEATRRNGWPFRQGALNRRLFNAAPDKPAMVAVKRRC